MAVADVPTIEHGPLELLFTVSEEQGLDGAKALDASLVTGRLLLNLDGTSDDALTIGSAGSDHTHLTVQLHSEPAHADHVACRVELSGRRAALGWRTSPGRRTRSRRSDASSRPRRGAFGS
jgi:dipeptidase D